MKKVSFRVSNIIEINKEIIFKCLVIYICHLFKILGFFGAGGGQMTTMPSAHQNNYNNNNNYFKLNTNLLTNHKICLVYLVYNAED